MDKPFLPPPLNCLLGAFWGAILATLMRQRMLPFLQGDTILSGGRQVPTEQFAHSTSNFFYSGAAVFFALGVASALSLTDARRRHIAQLPRWQRWMYRPFDSAAPHTTSAGQSVGLAPTKDARPTPLPDLPTALRRYWYCLIGVASFASIMEFLHPPIWAVPPFFFGVAFLAMWPFLTKRAPFTFWILACGVWMGGAVLAGIIGSLVRW